MATTATRSARERKILLADEQTASRDLLRLVLKRLGYRVEAVGNGKDALTRMAAERYDLILLSSSLPDMGLGPFVRGTSTTAAGARGLPPILAIDREGPVDPEETQGLPVKARLSRPIEIEQLLRLARRLLLAADDDREDGAADLPIMDIDHFASFTDGDAALESELAALYISSAEVYLGQMREALEAKAPWTRFAHALKGASANLGARRVAALALTAEHAPPSSEQLEAMRQAVEGVKSFFSGRHS